MIISYKRKIKLFLKVFFLLTLIGCTYILLKYPLEGEYLFSIPMIFFSIYGWIYMQMFSLEISDNIIHVNGFLINKSISVDKIVQVGMFMGALEVKSLERKITITTDLENYKEAIEFVLRKLKNKNARPVLVGDMVFLERYLS